MSLDQIQIDLSFLCFRVNVLYYEVCFLLCHCFAEEVQNVDSGLSETETWKDSFYSSVSGMLYL